MSNSRFQQSQNGEHPTQRSQYRTRHHHRLRRIAAGASAAQAIHHRVDCCAAGGALLYDGISGAGEVIGIDRYPERLEMARKHVGSTTINYEEVDSVLEVLKDMTGGRGADSCIDAVYGIMDKFPIGAIMKKGLTVGTAQQHGQKYMRRMIDHAQKGEFDLSFLATHRLPLEQAATGYDQFKHKTNGCVRSVFLPN